MKEFILYSYFRSSASFRVRIGLQLKGLDYEYRAIHLLNNGGEQNTEEYRRINPSRQVPTLIHGERTLSQSMAILDYLDHLKPEPRLFPSDAFQRALVIQACEIVNSGIQPLHNTGLLTELERKFNATQEVKNEWAAHWIRQGADTLERFLQPHAGKFCIGDTVSAADCFVIPHLFNCDRFAVNLADFPTLRKIRQSCEALEAFKRAAPGVQPDTPKT